MHHVKFLRFILLAFLFSGLSASLAGADGGVGVVEGQILNGTAGGSNVSDQTVTLQVYDTQQQIDEQTTQTDGQGAFRFDGLATGPDFYYRALVTYQGVSYQSRVGQILQPDEPLKLDMTVYDATEDGSAISVKESHLLVAFSPGAAVIHEMMLFNNAGDRSYVGSEPVNGGMGSAITLRFPLPPGVRDLKPQEGLMSCCVVDTDDGFVYSMPVLPGTQPVVFSYRVPYRGTSFQLNRPLAYSTAKFNVLMPVSDVTLSSDDLTEAELVTGEDGTQYRRLSGSDLSAGSEVVVHLEGIPAVENALPAAQPAPARGRLAGYGLLTGGGVLLLATAALLWRRSSKEGEGVETDLESGEEAAADSY